MSVEERSDRAISITRGSLMSIMGDPVALVQMAGRVITPEVIEETVLDILAYLDKTQPEEGKTQVWKEQRFDRLEAKERLCARNNGNCIHKDKPLKEKPCVDCNWNRDWYDPSQTDLYEEAE